MELRELAIGLGGAAAVSGAACAGPLPLDTPVAVGSVETVCTAAGSGSDPRWAAYPVRVEFSNPSAQYLAGAHVTLTSVAGTTLADFDCAGPAMLFKLPRGLYTVSAKLSAANIAPASAKFQPPATGQKRIVLRFTTPP
ncbi:MAG: hypothetical protein JO261_14680 [Alphaproteobacteria bacterium]|nr:hypothetical protein [Alphaproteobacteria bacterium]